MASQTLNKYRIWCVTEQIFVYIWGDVLPTKCPNNESHEIDSEQIGTVDRLSKNDVNVSSIKDELDRPYVRAESRDDHDTTYFTTRGDKWTSVIGEVVRSGASSSSAGQEAGSETEFYLDNKEVRNVAIYVGEDEIENFSIDVSEFEDNNKATHFSTGKITFDVAPPDGVEITADYEYATISGDSDNSLEFDFESDESPKTIDIGFCDPAHIKDGVVFYQNGELDSKMNVYVICPEGNYYKNNNGGYAYASTDTIIAHYVVEQPLLGTAEMGVYFDVEARSTAVPNNYKIRVTIDKGSATTLKGCVRLEINRQRTVIL